MRKLLFPFALLLFISCNDVKQKAQDTIDKSSEAVGETANKIIEDVADGVDRTLTLDSKIVLSEVLKAQGITMGKFYTESNSLGKNNKLVVYIISEKDFKGSLTFKVIDKNGLETGRQSLKLNRKAGEAAYHDIIFDDRTDIEVKSTIQID